MVQIPYFAGNTSWSRSKVAVRSAKGTSLLGPGYPIFEPCPLSIARLRASRFSKAPALVNWTLARSLPSDDWCYSLLMMRRYRLKKSGAHKGTSINWSERNG